MVNYLHTCTIATLYIWHSNLELILNKFSNKYAIHLINTKTEEKHDKIYDTLESANERFSIIAKAIVTNCCPENQIREMLMAD